MKILKNLPFAVIIFTLLVSCGGRKSQNLLPKDDLINLLVDLHLMDAVATDYAINRYMGNLDSASIYSSVLAKYNTDKEGFDATMNWYSGKPEDLAEIYDEVFGILNRRHEDLEAMSRLFSGGAAKEIFSNLKYRNYTGDSVSYPDPYIVELSGATEYFFDLRVRMLESDQSKDPFISISLLKSESDTQMVKEIIRKPLLKSNFSRDYQYNYVLKDSTYKFVKIVVPETVDRNSFKQKDLQVSKIRVMMRLDKEIEKE